MAKVPGITPESVWDYFVEAMLPGIIRWQARSKSEVDSPMLGDLLLNVAHKVVHISEVIFKIFQKIYSALPPDID